MIIKINNGIEYIEYTKAGFTIYYRVVGGSLDPDLTVEDTSNKISKYPTWWDNPGFTDVSKRLYDRYVDIPASEYVRLGKEDEVYEDWTNCIV